MDASQVRTHILHATEVGGTEHTINRQLAALPTDHRQAASIYTGAAHVRTYIHIQRHARVHVHIHKHVNIYVYCLLMYVYFFGGNMVLLCEYGDDCKHN